MTTRDILTEYPLRDIQKGLLFHSLQSEYKALYVNQALISMKEAVNVSLLEQAWQKIIDNYETLRSGFKVGDDYLTQIVLKSATCHINLIDLSNEKNKVKRYHEILQQDKQKPFNFANPPLMRFTLIEIAKNDYCFIWTYHHILLDGFSALNVFKEAITTYDLLMEGKAAEISPGQNQKDYIKFLEGINHVDEKKYWKKLLTGYVPENKLWSKQNNEAPQSAVQFTLTNSICKNLKDFAKQNKVTINITLQLAWGILLRSYFNTDDVVFGTVRTIPKLFTKSQPGLYMNIFPMRLKFDDKLQITSYVDDARLQNSQIHKYVHSSILQIQNWAGIKSNTHLFDSVISFLPQSPNAILKASGKKFRHRSYTYHIDTNYNLFLECAEDGNKLIVRLYYNIQVLTKAEAIQVINHFKNILENMILNSSTVISEISLLNETEYNLIINEWNNTKVVYKEIESIAQQISSMALKYPEKPAIIYNDNILTYRALNDQANHLAQHLHSKGVSEHSVVGVLIERSPDVIVSMIAIMKIGAAFLSVSHELPRKRIDFMLKNSNVEYIITRELYLPLLKKSPSDNLVLLDKIYDQQSSSNAFDFNTATSADQRVYVIYTSGSSGKPKGVEITLFALNNILCYMRNKLGVDEEAAFLAATTFSFDISLLEIFLPLTSGARIVLTEENAITHPQQVITTIIKHKINYIQATPAALQVLLSNGWVGDEKINILCGGDILPPRLAENLYRKCKQLWNVYGPTETTIWSTLYQVLKKDLTAKTIPIGKPIANTHVYVLDELLKPAPIGIIGELYIGGSGVAIRYSNNTKLTDSKFINNPFTQIHSKIYKTGDLARLSPDGNLEYIGRTDNQIKLNGFRIELEEIESILNKHPEVKQAIAFTKTGAADDKQLIASVVLKDPKKVISKAALNKFLKNYLPAYMLPNHVVFLDYMPVNKNGKIDRNILKNFKISNKISNHRFIKPNTKAEKMLIDIWATVLQIDPKNISMRDNVFAIGANSLLTIKASLLIQKAFKIHFPIREIFQADTLSSLAKRIEYFNSKGHLPIDITCYEKNVPIPLSFSQQRIWFLEQIMPSKPVYNIPFIWYLNGPLNKEVLETSLKTLIKRHESLRTTFSTAEGKVEQIIHTFDENSFTIKTVDISAETDNQLRKLIFSDIIKPFDFENGPLFRVLLYKKRANVHYLEICFSHMVADNTSANIIAYELSMLYSSIINKKPLSLPPISVQYSDFCLWQHEHLTDVYLNESITYWKNKLKNPTKINLPVDKLRPVNQSYNGNSIEFKISATILKKLHGISQQFNTTLFTVILSVFNILLARYTSQTDIIIGSPIAGRDHEYLEKLVGCFINIIALRSDLSNNQTFVELLKQNKTVTSEAYTHREIPFEKMVNLIEGNRDQSYNPIFQVMFALTTIKPLLLSDIKSKQIFLSNKTSKFDLSLLINETSNDLHCIIEYNSDIFKASTISTFIHHFHVLMSSIAYNPYQDIFQYYLLSNSDMRRILIGREPYLDDRLPDSLVDRFANQCNVNPNKIAIKISEHKISYSTLDRFSSHIANKISRLATSSGSPVAIDLPRGLESIIAIIATIKCNLPYLTITDKYNKNRDHKLSVYITTTNNTNNSYKNKIHKDNILYIDAELRKRKLDSEHFIASSQQPFVLGCFYNDKRGQDVKITDKSVLNTITHLTNTVNTALDNVGSVTPHCSHLFLVDLFMALCHGATLILHDNNSCNDGNDLLAFIKKNHISFMQAQPQIWKKLVSAGWKNDEQLSCICSGLMTNYDILSNDTFKSDRFYLYHTDPEELLFSVIFRLDTIATKDNPLIGKSINNTYGIIFNKNRCIQPIGISGELYINPHSALIDDPANLTSNGVVKNYIKDDKHPYFYNTGLVGKLSKDNTFEFLCFKDDYRYTHGNINLLRIIDSMLMKNSEIKYAQTVPALENNGIDVANIVPNTPKQFKSVSFSLFFFGEKTHRRYEDQYNLILDCAKFADENEFSAIWTPERHFNKLGACFPNPVVLSAAIASITSNLKICAGSVVLPLHNTIRVAEEWSVIDNLSRGRVGLAFATGWNPRDFVFAPDSYKNRKHIMFKQIETFTKLWSGDSISLTDGNDINNDITIYPRPFQKRPPIWITAAINSKTFFDAGKIGANILSHLANQNLEELRDKIAIYRESIKKSTNGKKAGHVTIMIHTLILNDYNKAITIGKKYLRNYLGSHTNLLISADERLNEKQSSLPKDARNKLIKQAIERYIKSVSLIGTPESCLEVVKKLKQNGVDEIACLIDFGVPKHFMMETLKGITTLKKLSESTNDVSLIDLHKYVNDKIPRYLRPADYRLVHHVNAHVSHCNLSKNTHSSRKIKKAARDYFLAPNTSYAKRIALIWSNILHVESNTIGLLDDFFSLGGSSITSIQLVSELNNTFKIRLDVNVIFDCPTLMQLSQLVEDEIVLQNDIYSLFNREFLNQQNSTIVKLKAGKDKTPIFLIHPIAGTVFCYIPLARFLNNNRTIYGVQNPCINPRFGFFKDIKAMASFYANEIQQCQPEGPYYLAGASFGSLLAIEIAKRLNLSKHRVNFIGLIDGWASPTNYYNTKEEIEELLSRQRKLLEDEIKTHVYDGYDQNRQLEVLMNSRNMETNYRCTSIPFELTLFKAEQIMPAFKGIDTYDNNWQQFCPHSLKIYKVPGDHETMLATPNVQVLAKQINLALSKLEPESNEPPEIKKQSVV